MPYRIHTLRLECSTFWVDARYVRVSGRWIASADTPNGPTLGYGPSAFQALWMALEPFEGLAEELLASAPAHVVGDY
jgi:hypothetical protein